jgi:hypothetical protein
MFDLSAEPSEGDVEDNRGEWYKVEHSSCFDFIEEHKKFGYVCDSTQVGEHITFSVDYAKYLEKYAPDPAKATQPSNGTTSYVWEIGFLSSYEGMGIFDCQVTCTSASGGTVTSNETLTVDSQWKQRISVYTTKQLVVVPSPAGKCSIKVVPQAKKDGRTGNKVKVLSIGVSAQRAGACKQQGNQNGNLGFSLCF